MRELTSLGLKEAKDLVDGTPEKPVLEKVAKEAADKAAESLKAAALPSRSSNTSGVLGTPWARRARAKGDHPSGWSPFGVPGAGALLFRRRPVG
ncbi:hypothetical protein SBADM41S_11943 [Streptomyces badius]